MAPGGGHPISSYADLDTMSVHRTIITAAHIILAGPYELHRRAAQTLRNHRGFARHMRIDHCAPAETTAGIFSVKSNLFRLQSENLSNRHLVHRLKLRRHPSLCLVAFKA